MNFDPNEWNYGLYDLQSDVENLAIDVQTGHRTDWRALTGFGIIVIGAVIAALVVLPFLGAGVYIAGDGKRKP